MKEALDLSPLVHAPELHPYLKLYHGEIRRLSEMGPALPAVHALVNEGKAVMQYELPFDGREDARVWMPERQTDGAAPRHNFYEAHRR